MRSDQWPFAPLPSAAGHSMALRQAAALSASQSSVTKKKRQNMNVTKKMQQKGVDLCITKKNIALHVHSGEPPAMAACVRCWLTDGAPTFATMQGERVHHPGMEPGTWPRKASMSPLHHWRSL